LLVVLFAEFLILSVQTDLHLVRFIAHGFWSEAIVHGFLDADVNVVGFVVLGHLVQADAVAIDIYHVLSVLEHQNVILKVLGIQGCLTQEFSQVLLLHEGCLFKDVCGVVVVPKAVVFDQVILKMEQVLLVQFEDSSI
jgi:hypothetical protein